MFDVRRYHWYAHGMALGGVAADDKRAGLYIAAVLCGARLVVVHRPEIWWRASRVSERIAVPSHTTCMRLYTAYVTRCIYGETSPTSVHGLCAISPELLISRREMKAYTDPSWPTILPESLALIPER